MFRSPSLCTAPSRPYKDGQVIRLDTRTQSQRQPVSHTHGDVIGGKMKLILESGGQSRLPDRTPWSDEIRGPYAAEQSMAREPMKENETRSLNV